MNNIKVKASIFDVNKNKFVPKLSKAVTPLLTVKDLYITNYVKCLNQNAKTTTDCSNFLL